MSSLLPLLLGGQFLTTNSRETPQSQRPPRNPRALPSPPTTEPPTPEYSRRPLPDPSPTSAAMKLSVFSAKPYDQEYLSRVQQRDHASFSVTYHDFALSEKTASLAAGSDAVCVFVNDVVSAPVLASLSQLGVRAVLLRCAGFNNVDLAAAERHGLFVANVPSYSPEAVAEFAVALLQTLNRRTHRAYNRVREGNFSLDGLLGRTLHGKTVGIVGVGRIGLALARILRGFGCRLVAYDPFPLPEFTEHGEYVALDALLAQSDFVSLHCPLMDATKHVINAATLAQMRRGAVLVNTSRGGLIDTKALIAALKTGHLGGVALDVYEGEGGLFYQDHSGDIIQDDDLMRLMTFPNVLMCGHQAFFTEEALTEIAECTLRNLEDFAEKRHCSNSLVSSGKPMVRRDSAPVRI
ncbi:putative D-lactate dehydrogenase [Schizothecium vesticola]|uniref:D-lactate dehydrogenase n=1 Tax=Schizothecium vesticola TaxID=314040 RepID=A0AA40F639_9PEZI|nr:putative D-lactate dehydrogenase [Schizothecium vesticola]